MNSGSKVLLGVLAGAAAGAILGVLFAPEAGTETRRRLGEGSRDVANNLKSRFSDLVDNIADKYEAAREGATDLIDRGKQAVSGATGGSGGTGTGTAGTSGLGAGAAAAGSNIGGSAYQS